jgi:hypothetical protein
MAISMTASTGSTVVTIRRSKQRLAARGDQRAVAHLGKGTPMRVVGFSAPSYGRTNGTTTVGQQRSGEDGYPFSPGRSGTAWPERGHDCSNSFGYGHALLLDQDGLCFTSIFSHEGLLAFFPRSIVQSQAHTPASFLPLPENTRNASGNRITQLVPLLALFLCMQR